MLANILITTCIFTLIVMPRILQWLGFWLQPAHRRSSMRKQLVGTMITALAIAAMVILFRGIV